MKSLTAFVLLIGAALPTFARATPPDVKELQNSTEVFTRCAKIADEIAGMKVPAGHAEARAQKAANETADAKGVVVKIDDVHAKFMTDMDAKVARLDACGKEYEVAVKASEELIEKIAAMNIAEADGHAIEDVIKKYHASKDVLTDSVAGLSKDVQIQSYVHKTLRAHFLKNHKKQG
jgi:hypothetical protein